MISIGELFNLGDHELLLIDFFRDRASLTLAHGKVDAHYMWKNDAVSYAVQYSPPVLAALLAVSEFQYTWNKIDRIQASLHAEKYYRKAVELHRLEVMGQTEASSPESLILSSALLSLYVMLDNRITPVIADKPGQLDLLGILRGCVTLYEYFESNKKIQGSFVEALSFDGNLMKKEDVVRLEFLETLEHEVREAFRLGVIDKTEHDAYVDSLSGMAMLYSMALQHNIYLAVTIVFNMATPQFTDYCRIKRPLGLLILNAAIVVYLKYLDELRVPHTSFFLRWYQVILNSYHHVPFSLHHYIDEAIEILECRAPPWIGPFLTSAQFKDLRGTLTPNNILKGISKSSMEKTRKPRTQ